MSNETEVVLKLAVETADGSKAMKSLADDTKKAAGEAKGAQKEFDALGEAQKRLKAQAQEKQVKSQMQRLSPSADFDPAAAAHRSVEHQHQARQVERERQKIDRQKWQDTPWAKRSAFAPGQLGKMASAAAPLIGVAAFAHQAVGAAGSSAREVGDLAAERAATGGGGVSANEATQSFARNLAESIPILGGFVKGIGDMASAANRAAAQMELANIRVQERQNSGARFEIAQKAEAERTKHGLATGAGDAAAEFHAKRDYANSLTPQRLAQFSGAYGAERKEMAKAHSDVQSLREQVANRQRAIDKNLPGYADAKSSAAARAHDADAAITKARAATREKEKWAAGFGHVGFYGHGKRKDLAETEAVGNAVTTAGSSATADASALEKAKTIEGQLTDLQQKRVALAQTELVERQKTLALHQKMVGENVQGAIKFGSGTRADAARYGALGRQFQQQGLDGMTPAQIAELRSGPLGSLIEDAEKKRGAKWMDEEGIGKTKAQIAEKQFTRDGDTDAKGHAAINAKSIEEQEGDVEKQSANAEADTAQQKAGIAEKASKQLADIVGEVMELVLDGFKRDLEAKVQHGILQKKGQ